MPFSPGDPTQDGSWARGASLHEKTAAEESFLCASLLAPFPQVIFAEKEDMEQRREERRNHAP